MDKLSKKQKEIKELEVFIHIDNLYEFEYMRLSSNGREILDKLHETLIKLYSDE